MLSTRRETWLLLLGDIFFLVLSLWLALLLRTFRLPTTDYFFEHFWPFILVFSVSLLVFFISGLYEKQTRLVKSILGVRIAGAQATNTLLAAVFFFILPFAIAPKTILLLYLAVSVLLVSVWRFFIAPNLSIIEKEKAILVGHGETIEEAYLDSRRNPKHYVHFTEHIDPTMFPEGSLATAIQARLSSGVSLIVIDLSSERVRKELDSLYALLVSGVSFVAFSTFYESLYDRVALTHVDNGWLLESLPKHNLLYSLSKRGIDIFGGLIGMLLTSPVIVIAVVVLLLTGGRPFIYHLRVGQGGREFNIIKLRSMLLNDHGDPELQKENKVTRVGYILRKTRIDELPQLINILKGELSFIGPRPELPSIAHIYEKEIPFYHARHLVPPGLSGWAQIYHHDAPRGSADILRTTQKLSYDLYYVKHRSFRVDLAIALKTLRALASFSGT